MLRIHLSIKILTILTSLVFTSLSFAKLNDPIQLNDEENSNVVLYELDPNSQYVVFNEFDKNGDLNRFTRTINGKSTSNQVGTDLSSLEDNIFIDGKGLRILHRAEDTQGRESLIISNNIDGSSDEVLISTFSQSNPAFETISRRNSDLLTPARTSRIFFTTEESNNLYTIQSDGSSPAINLTNNLNVTNFEISKDRQTVFFSASSNNSVQLFSTNTDGTSAPLLITNIANVTIPEDFSFFINNQETKIFYTIRSTTTPNNSALSSNRVTQIFSVNIEENSVPTSVIEPQENLGSFIITNDGQFVVFGTQEFVSGIGFQSNLYISPIDRSSEATLIDSGIQITQRLRDANNSQFLVYSIIELAPNSDITQTVIKSIPFSTYRTTEPIIISEVNNNIGANIDRNILFTFDPSEEFVFYVDDSREEARVFRASIDGSSPLLNIVGERNNLRFRRPQSLDIIDNQLFFLGFSLTGGVEQASQLYSASLDGLDVTQISSLSINDSLYEAVDFQISDNGQFAVYAADNLNTNGTDLFSVDLGNPDNIDTEETCFPVKTKIGDISIICF